VLNCGRAASDLAPGTGVTGREAVFITGVGSGLGLELARRFLADGAQVGGCSIESAAQLGDGFPKEIDYVQADVCDAAAMRAAIGAFAARAGRLDILVANAGISMPKAALPDFAAGRRVLDVNLLGTINSFEPALAAMREQGQGQLVALGSVAGIVGLPGMAFYGASKAAILHFCESLACDLHPYGIAVTAIAPGFVATALTRGNAHAMPFLMQPGAAVDRIYRAIRRRRARVVIPWQMALIAGLLYHLPRSVYRALMRLDLSGLRR
jgi:NAD(P)-dependent dehydrogenase (short-subunit alcohol dehydrogenase family)